MVFVVQSLGLFRRTDRVDMEANDPEALELLLVQLKQIVNSASSAQLWAKPPIIDSSFDENGDLVETQENDTPGLRQFKVSVSKEIEGIENVSQLP
jgi:lipid II:glycine glycyltransferase (peptidoglycan interpeptide bridge formation enzyme)